MWLEFELWRDRISVHIGDFTEAMFVLGKDSGNYISGLVTESQPGYFGFCLLIHNIGIGISLRFVPGPYDPEKEDDFYE